MCASARYFSGARNQVIQGRIDALAALVESEGDEDSAPYLVTMVGDSTMMQQHGVVCAYLAQREGRRFDPRVSLS